MTARMPPLQPSGTTRQSIYSHAVLRTPYEDTVFGFYRLTAGLQEKIL